MLTIAVDATANIGAWWLVVAPLLSGVLGGIAGAFITGWRMGAWRAETAQNRKELERIDGRLARGDDKLAALPGLLVAAKELRSELQAASRDMQRLEERFVTRRECDLRHGKRTG